MDRMLKIRHHCKVAEAPTTFDSYNNALRNSQERIANMQLTHLAKVLISSKAKAEQLTPKAEPGIYAWFLCNTALIPLLAADVDKPIYIGRAVELSKRTLRQHLESGRTCSSTLRRSLGALLKGKDQLDLTASHRGDGKNNNDYTNFLFSDAGEDRLTAWMHENLRLGICAAQDYISAEHQTISVFHPPLNLMGWENPLRKEIKALRKICADEARCRR